MVHRRMRDYLLFLGTSPRVVHVISREMWALHKTESEVSSNFPIPRIIQRNLVLVST